MKLVFATHNPNKLREIQLLVPKHIQVVSLDEIGCTDAIPETASTLKGNAKLKADFIFENYNLPCFADDTGLLVNVLNGKPGVYSARYAGEANDAEANMKKLLHNLKGEKNRSASFKTVIALRLSEKIQFFEGSVLGEISTEKKGAKGFGYDPIFKPLGYSETFAQLPISVKNDIGHRGKAFAKLVKFLNTLNVTA